MHILYDIKNILQYISNIIFLKSAYKDYPDK